MSTLYLIARLYPAGTTLTFKLYLHKNHGSPASSGWKNQRSWQNFSGFLDGLAASARLQTIAIFESL
jgi:hypothetical protein